MRDYSKTFVLIGLVLLVVGLTRWMGGGGLSIDWNPGLWIPLVVLFFVVRGGGCGRRRSCGRSSEPAT